MKKTLTALILTCLGANVIAQTKNGTRSSGQLAAEAADTASRLNATRQAGEVEAGKLNAERQTERTMAAKAAQAAADLLLPRDAAETATTKRADASMSAAMKNLSPAGRVLLAQSDAAGATKAPDRPSSSTAAAPPTGGAPKPAPLKSATVANPDAQGKPIIITCTGAAYFDSKTSVALFTENVEVRHPQFFVSCDEFEVHMVKDEAPKDGAPAGTAAAGGAKGKSKGKAADPIKNPLAAPPGQSAPGGAASGNAAADGMGESSIKFAIARGRMVTIEKLTENGEVQIGHSKHATYEGATGNITLREFPQVQRGQHLQIATDPSTVMVLKQNGALDTKGPSRTEIIQQQEKKPTRLNSLPPAPNASPNPGATPNPGASTSPRAGTGASPRQPTQ